MCSVMKRVGYADGFQWLSNFLKWEKVIVKNPVQSLQQY
jgi:hypothetical protein